MIRLVPVDVVDLIALLISLSSPLPSPSSLSLFTLFSLKEKAQRTTSRLSQPSSHGIARNSSANIDVMSSKNLLNSNHEAAVDEDDEEYGL